MATYRNKGIVALAGAGLALAFLAGSPDPSSGQALAQGANDECVPLEAQYPDLGTSQSVSARREFTTVWGSFELPGGPCGYESAEAHYNALL